jgi:hypothetical protein
MHAYYFFKKHQYYIDFVALIATASHAFGRGYSGKQEIAPKKRGR